MLHAGAELAAAAARIHAAPGVGGTLRGKMALPRGTKARNKRGGSAQRTAQHDEDHSACRQKRPVVRLRALAGLAPPPPPPVKRPLTFAAQMKHVANGSSLPTFGGARLHLARMCSVLPHRKQMPTVSFPLGSDDGSGVSPAAPPRTSSAPSTVDSALSAAGQSRAAWPRPRQAKQRVEAWRSASRAERRASRFGSAAARRSGLWEGKGKRERGGADVVSSTAAEKGTKRNSKPISQWRRAPPVLAAPPPRVEQRLLATHTAPSHHAAMPDVG
jgi:hypothetical protein